AVNGATAQEEDLCRSSNLLAALHLYRNLTRRKRHEYFITPREAALLPSVTVFARSDKQRPMFMVDVVAAAAVELVNSRISTDSDKINMLASIRALIRASCGSGKRNWVLGAHGCGAFHWPAQDVAEFFHEVLAEPEFHNTYDSIVFAIMVSTAAHNRARDENNLLWFQKRFTASV
ncbi:MAG: TIGR02452 family protein, partial [Proteobacteria bacterium]|nr:TIGR02452 family protein [Pseudomonadota bacterium]